MAKRLDEAPQRALPDAGRAGRSPHHSVSSDPAVADAAGERAARAPVPLLNETCGWDTNAPRPLSDETNRRDADAARPLLLSRRGRFSLPQGAGYALALAALLRVALSVVAAWMLTPRAPTETAAIHAQYLGQRVMYDLIVAPWQRFDALWYTRIAAQGYGAHDGSTVYYPLYPLLIKAVSLLTGGNAMAAGLIISTLLCAVLFMMLYQLVVTRHGEPAARRTVLLLCVFPTAVFLMGVYTESTFLACVVGCFLARERNRPLLAGALGLLAALTRLQGVVLAVPLLYMAWREWRDGRRAVAPWLSAALPLLGTLAFMLYTRVAMDGATITDVYATQVHQHLSPPWSTLGSYWSALMAHHWRLFSYPTGNWVDALNLALALGMLAVVLPARRLIGTPLWLYALATWCVTLCIHQSTARYMLTLFPALIVLAVRSRSRWTMRLALLIGAPLMLFIAGEYVVWSFVG